MSIFRGYPPTALQKFPHTFSLCPIRKNPKIQPAIRFRQFFQTIPLWNCNLSRLPLCGIFLEGKTKTSRPKLFKRNNCNSGLQIFSQLAKFSHFGTDFDHFWDQCKSVEKKNGGKGSWPEIDFLTVIKDLGSFPQQCTHWKSISKACWLTVHILTLHCYVRFSRIQWLICHLEPSGWARINIEPYGWKIHLWCSYRSHRRRGFLFLW